VSSGASVKSVFMRAVCIRLSRWEFN